MLSPTKSLANTYPNAGEHFVPWAFIVHQMLQPEEVTPEVILPLR